VAGAFPRIAFPNPLMTEGYLPVAPGRADAFPPLPIRLSMRAVPILLSSVLLAACAGSPVAAPSAPVTASLHGDAARPASAPSGWVRSELYFGVGKANVDPTVEAIGEAQWREFLDREVTPRFPDGLTVLDGYGQWTFRGNPEPNRLQSKVLVILHEDNPRRTADIEAIRLAWKQVHGHQSVLWSRQPIAVSF